MTHPRTARRSLIAVIGDAGRAANEAKVALAEEIGRRLVDSGYRVITGGLDGVMAAALRGAAASSKYAPGDTVALVPGHDPAEANEWADIAIATGLDHVRNSIVAHSDAVIAIGGGAGTLSEICFAWMYRRLIVGLRVDGWSGELADRRMDGRIRYPNLSDDRVFGAVTAAEAVSIVTERLDSYCRRSHGISRAPSDRVP